MRARTLALGLCLWSACGAETERDEPHAHKPAPDVSESRQPLFCSRPGDDAVRDAFCTDAPPATRSLFDLQVRLNLRPATDQPEAQGTPGDAYYTLSSVTVLGHSTALSGHLVSSINPRAIVMSTETFLA